MPIKLGTPVTVPQIEDPNEVIVQLASSHLSVSPSLLAKSPMNENDSQASPVPLALSSYRYSYNALKWLRMDA
jgi:hypothetical protein